MRGAEAEEGRESGGGGGGGGKVAAPGRGLRQSRWHKILLNNNLLFLTPHACATTLLLRCARTVQRRVCWC